MDSFVNYTEVDVWLQDTFLSWGHEALPEILATWEDGEAEPLVELAFYKVTIEFPRFQRTDDGTTETPGYSERRST